MMSFIRLLIIGFIFAAAPQAWAGDNSDQDDDRNHADIPSGTMLYPGECDTARRQTDSDGQRKCMKVCREWGEDCIIDPRQGTRKCRRSCRQFGVECFDP